MRIIMRNRAVFRKRNLFKVFCLILLISVLFIFNVFPRQTGRKEKEYKDIPTKWLILDERHNFHIDYCQRFPSWTILTLGFEQNLTSSNCINLNEKIRFKPLPQKLEPIQQAILYAFLNGAKFIFSPANDVDISDVIGEVNDLLTSYPGKLYTFLRDSDRFDSAKHFQCRAKTRDCLKAFSLCLAPGPSLVLPTGPRDGDTCSSKMIPVALLPNTFVSLRGESTIIGRSAFWAAPLLWDFPIFSLKTKFKLNCAIQWFLWYTGGFVQVYWSEFLTVTELESKSEECRGQVDRLNECKTSAFQCIVSAMEGILSDDEFKDFTNWMEILKRYGYEIQTTRLRVSDCSRAVINSAEYCSSQGNYHFVRYETSNSEAISKTYEKTCWSDFQSTNVKLDEPWFRMTNVLLLVVFNKAHYGVIPYLEILYRPFFPMILYCGPEELDLGKHAFLEDYLVSFITYDRHLEGRVPGALNYQCMLKALEMNFKVRGILNVADDLLVLNRQVPEMNVDELWFIPNKETKIGDLKRKKECLLGICDFYARWPWWSDYRKESLVLLEEVESLSKRSKRMKLFQKTLERFTGGTSRLVGGYSDVFYVPRRLSLEFLELGRLFLRHGVFLEIAVPSIIFGLSSHEEVMPLGGLQVWDAETRDRPWVNFQKSKLFGKFYFHPVKWSSLAGENTSNAPLPRNCSSGKGGDGGVECDSEVRYNLNNSAEMTGLFCQSVLPYFYDPFGLLPDISTIPT